MLTDRTIAQYRKIRDISEGNTMANMALAVQVRKMNQANLDRVLQNMESVPDSPVFRRYERTYRHRLGRIIDAINERDNDAIHNLYVETMLDSVAYDIRSFEALSSYPLIVQCVDIAALLPHGGGIDDIWSVTETSNSVRLHNSYHCMDENGMYEDWQDFTIIIPKSALGNNDAIAARFKLQFNGDRYMANKYQLREYLEDTIAYHLTMDDSL